MNSCIIVHPISPFPDGQVCVRVGRSGFLSGEGDRRRLSRRDPRIARHQGHPPQARPVHQRRSRHDEPFPARGGVRHRGRRRDRPRPRPLRALPVGEDAPEQQFHHRPDLRLGDQEGTPRGLPRAHGAGDPARHRRNQIVHRARRGRRGSGDRGDRRHRGRHRVAAVPRSGTADGARAGAAPTGRSPTRRRRRSRCSPTSRRTP